MRKTVGQVVSIELLRERRADLQRWRMTAGSRAAFRGAVRSVRKGCRESESGQGAAVKACHCRDLGARKGENHQPDCVEAAGLRVAGVEAEGGLAVGPGWYQPGGPAGPEC